MNKRVLASVLAAGLLGSGLVWMADREKNDGIEGWEALNAGMAQALGGADGANTAAAGDNREEGSSGLSKANSTKTDARDKEDESGTAAGGESGMVYGTEAANTAESGSSAGSDGIAGAAAAPGSAAAAPASADSTPVTGNAASAGQVSSDGRINVNTADAAVLMDLPGIGEKKAQAIIDYRSSKGAFRSLSDLGEVKGIGPKMLEKLGPLVIFKE